MAYRIQEQSGPLSGHDHPSGATAGLWADLDSIPTDSSTNNVAPPSSHLLTLKLWVPWLLGQWPLLLQPFSPVVHITSYAVSLVSVFVFLSVSRLHLCSPYFLSYIASAECLVKFLLFFVFLSTCVKFLYLVYSCVCLLMKSVYFFICTKLLCCSQSRFPVLFIHHSIQVFSLFPDLICGFRFSVFLCSSLYCDPSYPRLCALS